MQQLKKAFIVLAMIVLVFWGYVLIVNTHSTNMTGRQEIIKAMYPALVWINKVTNKNVDIITHEKKMPPVSFYSLTAIQNDGTPISTEIITIKSGTSFSKDLDIRENDVYLLNLIKL